MINRVARKSLCSCAVVVVGVVVAIGLAAPAAQANLPIYSFAAQPASTTLQAGAHPDVAFTFELGNRQQTPANPCDCEDARNIVIHLPPGLIGNPHSTPQCTITQFASTRCPPDSQVGITEDQFSISPGGSAAGFVAAVYNLVPPPDEPALLAFETTISTPVFINISARTGSDYGIDATVSNIDHYIPLAYSQTSIWGVPAAHIHDELRFGLGETPPLIGLASLPFLCSANQTPATTDPASIYQFCEEGIGGPGPNGYGKGFRTAKDGGGAIGDCTLLEGGCGGPGEPVVSNSPEIPFFQNPTTCGESSLKTSLDVLSYDNSESQAESPYPATTDCNQLSFNPSQAIEPTTTAADSPSGAEFRLTVPQFESPAVPSPSELKAAVVTLPSGFTLAPNVTNGKETCSDAQARFGTTEEAECPENSKIGTLTVETPVLPGPLPGAVYLGEPKPGNRYRLILAFNGFGVHIKLPGTVTPDPATGQIAISFQNLPQAPLAEFNMHIFGSERGPMDTPTRCGKYEVSSEWTPWDSALSNQVSRQFFEVNEGPEGTPCPSGPRPFHPGFQAASQSNSAGAHTSFSANLTRKDGEQNLSGLTIKTPPGFAATLKGIPYCPQSALEQLGNPLYSGSAELAAPLCAASQVGTLTAGVGPGSHQLYLPGKLYLAGPYKGAPLSLEAVIPAVSGPYDLGNVAVRVAVNVDPTTAQVTTTSDPFPQIFGGIPIRARQILFNLDRPNFALNPTNCDPFAVTGSLSGDEGALANVSSHFQVANCASLAFAPKLSLKLSGGTKRAANPALKAVINYPKGVASANIASTSVTLPHSEFLDNAHIRNPCTRVQFAANACPASSVLGSAVAETPLLEKPLEGPVYLMTGFGHKLPDLIVDLKGQINIILDGRIDSVVHKLANGENAPGIRTTFETVPDAPVSKFTLNLSGASKGLLQNSTNLCSAPQRAVVRIGGQNGKSANATTVIQTPCGKAGKKKGRRSASKGSAKKKSNMNGRTGR